MTFSVKCGAWGLQVQLTSMPALPSVMRSLWLESFKSKQNKIHLLETQLGRHKALNPANMCICYDIQFTSFLFEYLGHCQTQLDDESAIDLQQLLKSEE